MPKINRRKFLKASSSALSALALAACGGVGSTDTAAPSAGAGAASTGAAPSTAGAASTAAAGSAAPSAAVVIPAGRTRVLFWSSWGGKNGEGMQKLVDDFNNSQTDIFVENQFQGSYEETAQKLTAALAARQVPDMASLSEVTWNRFYINQTLQDLDGYFTKANLDPTDYV